MAGQKIELGPTGQTVANNVKRVRELRALNYADLSRRVTDLGRPISALAVRRIEEGGRRVDADDLMVLSVALECSPVVLLSPDVPSGDESVEATGAEPRPARQLWDWLRADKPLEGTSTFEAMIHAQLPAPEWRRQQMYEGYSQLIELNAAEKEAAAGNPVRLNRLLEEHREP